MEERSLVEISNFICSHCIIVLLLVCFLFNREGEKIQNETLAELDKIQEEANEHEEVLKKKITETKENVRKLLLSTR